MDDSPSSSRCQKNNVITDSSIQENNIDLREFLIALWVDKWILVSCTIIFTIGTGIYSLKEKDTWTSNATVTAPNVHELAPYITLVSKYKPFFHKPDRNNSHPGQGTSTESDNLDNLLSSNMAFIKFIQEFNSNSNKTRFFELYKQKKNGYDDFFKAKINATAINKRKKEKYVLSSSSNANIQSRNTLTEYISFINNIVSTNAIGNLQTKITSKLNGLEQKKIILTYNAKLKLKSEIRKTFLSYEIAKNAKIENPIENLQGSDIFIVNLGSKILESKLKTLMNLRNLNLLEPELQHLDAKIDVLKKLSIIQPITFKSFHFIEIPDTPTLIDNPNKRIMTITLGSAMGLLVGVVIVFSRFTFKP